MLRLQALKIVLPFNREKKHQGVDVSRHFSYYAFDGGSGALRWKHEASLSLREAPATS